LLACWLLASALANHGSLSLDRVKVAQRLQP